MHKHGLNVTRFFVYIIGKCIAVVIAVLLVILGFYTAVNSSNVYMVVKDAFAKRTSVILTPEDNKDSELLSKLYTPSYLTSSKLGQDESNSDYTIQKYVERTDVKVTLVWPWYNKVQVEARNVVDDISAKISDKADTSSYKAVSKFITSGKYMVTLVKLNDKWYVDDLKMVEEVMPKNQQAVPTPAPTSTTASGTDDFVQEEVPATETAGTDNGADAAGDAAVEG